MRTEYFEKLVQRLKSQSIDAMLISPSEELLFIMGSSPENLRTVSGVVH